MVVYEKNMNKITVQYFEIPRFEIESFLTVIQKRSCKCVSLKLKFI